MEALYITLGAILALGGGVVTHHIQLHYSQLKEEARLLFDIEKSLLEMGGIASQLELISPNSGNLEDLSRKHSLNHEMLKQLESLHLLAIRITSNANRKVAILATKYSIDEHLRTEENRCSLLKQVQESINPKLLRQYEKEMESDPKKF